MTQVQADAPSSLGVIGTKRGLSLALAVLYHGFSCFAAGAIPSKVDTVIETATKFEAHLGRES